MRLWMIGLAASVALGTAAHALYREWGAWKSGDNLSASFWSKGAAALANRKERVGGHMLNSFDHFRYQGNTKALNTFLRDLDKVEGPRTIYLLGPEMNAGLINPHLEDADWTLSLSANGHSGLFLPAEGPNPVRELRFPESIELSREGNVGPEIERLVEQHERTRKANQKE